MTQHKILRDCDLRDWMTNPAIGKELDQNSREFNRLDVCYRAYWHAIFDPSQHLTDINSSVSGGIFIPFMSWAQLHGITFGWSLHIWILRWFLSDPLLQRYATPAFSDDMRSIAAALWTVSDKSQTKGIIIGDASSETWIAGWKTRSVDKIRVVEKLDLSEPIELREYDFGYFLSPFWDIDEFPGWKSIPK
ncbi:hypothetical protein ACLEIY_10985 [Acetobacter tropicalis]|uniref:hypothetical protein n=1 Tax=Acetobacter TaxID=434 RepID=UPI003974BB5D